MNNLSQIIGWLKENDFKSSVFDNDILKITAWTIWKIWWINDDRIVVFENWFNLSDWMGNWIASSVLSENVVKFQNINNEVVDSARNEMKNYAPSWVCFIWWVIRWNILELFQMWDCWLVIVNSHWKISYKSKPEIDEWRSTPNNFLNKDWWKLLDLWKIELKSKDRIYAFSDWISDNCSSAFFEDCFEKTQADAFNSILWLTFYRMLIGKYMNKHGVYEEFTKHFWYEKNEIEKMYSWFSNFKHEFSNDDSSLVIIDVK